MNANEFPTWGIWLRHIEANLATEKKDLDVTRWGRARGNPAIPELSLGQQDLSCSSPRSSNARVAGSGGDREILYFPTKGKANICPQMCFRD